MANVFDQHRMESNVPVTVEVDGEKKVVGQATLYNAGDHIHVEMDLKTDDPDDVMNLLGSGITGYSIADAESGKHVATQEQLQDRAHVTHHDHVPIQHRDGKPAWCHVCKLTEEYLKPESRFNFGKPANPLRGD